jgi:hypothetical protein
MALRTPQDYRASLQDERVIYYKGERADVTTHPVLGGVQHASIDQDGRRPHIVPWRRARPTDW